jgi:hypothetical protein
LSPSSFPPSNDALGWGRRGHADTTTTALAMPFSCAHLWQTLSIQPSLILVGKVLDGLPCSRQFPQSCPTPPSGTFPPPRTTTSIHDIERNDDRRRMHADGTSEARCSPFCFFSLGAAGTLSRCCLLPPPLSSNDAGKYTPTYSYVIVVVVVVTSISSRG